MSNAAEPINLEKLTEPFPKSAIKQREGGRGRMLDYVEGHTVIHRLNDATGNRWDLEVKDINTREIPGRDRDGKPVTNMMMTARVALKIPGLGTREHMGVQMVNERGGEDLVKGCITDALKKAATLFGVGLELYGPDYEAGELGRPLVNQARSGGTPARVEQVRERIATGGGPSPAQIKFLFALAQQNGLDEDGLHAQINARFHKTSIHDLSGGKDGEMSRMIEFLKNKDLIDGIPVARERADPVEAHERNGFMGAGIAEPEYLRNAPDPWA